MEKSLTSSQRPKANIFELLCIWIASVSFISIILLVLSAFNSLLAITLGTFLCLLFTLSFRLKVETTNKNFTFALFLILAVALILRVPPYHWIMGGEDQGVYLNMDATYERTGKTFITDHLREGLGTKEKEIYDEANHLIRGYHQPGVFITDLEKSEYVFQFYPLHPLWMSIFGSILGSDNGVYSLIFFSLISIIAFYFIALELTPGNRKAAYLIAIFLAINPLHAFFSKFPTSEIISLAFSSTGFYFLLKYYKESLQEKINFWRLLVSAGLFLSLFFNHISGFVYLPFFYLIIVLALLFVENTKIRRNLVMYCGLVLTACVLSVFYGFFYSPPYFWAIGKISFEPSFGQYWYKLIPILFFIGILLIPLCLAAKRNIQPLILRTAAFIKKYYPFVLYLFIAVNLYKIYGFAFGDEISTYPFQKDFPDLAHHGLSSILATNFVSIIYYLTPAGFIVLLMSIASFRGKNDVAYFLMLFFFSIFYFMRSILNPTVPYQFGLARYLLLEVIPYGLLIISLYLTYVYHQNNKMSRLLVKGTFLAIVLFSLYFTLPQIFVHEAKYESQTIQRISKQIEENDLVLIDDAYLMMRLSTPLTYYYDLNVASFTQPDIFPNRNNIYVISKQSLPLDNFDLVDKIDYYQEEMGRTNLIPHNSIIKNRFTLYLFKVK